eukprot:snap_masked-scaffold175_size286436-processed-gene-1.29 protein:Tk09295 transcript:snap_masked-scaffold175_size286436-processed-gene-1.29-mRNA-1 annotation:"alpha-( )-fucosyltransferase"
MFRRGIRWGWLIGALALVWVVGILHFGLKMLSSSTESELALQGQLTGSQQRVQRLEQDNTELRALLKQVQEAAPPVPPGGETSPLKQAVARVVDGPSLEYELMRRHVKRDLDEFWWFLRARLEGIRHGQDTPEPIQDTLRDTLVEAQHREQALQVAFLHQAEVDGFEQWREQEAQDLSGLVQKRLHHLQNPSDCGQAKKLVCSLNKGCGYGCQIHHAIYCFIVAYGTERMLVLKSKGWKYNKGGFEELFHPLSQTCPQASITGKRPWPGSPDSLVVELGIVDSVNPRPEFLPPSIPRDLSERIIRLHGDPIVWWVSQFLKFMLKPQPHLQELLDQSVEAQGFARPLVGIHVRRTDKVGTEAALHEVGEYMKHVSEYFQLQEVKLGRSIPTKSVYVATDDPKVLQECRDKFPDYTFHGSLELAKSAAVSSRYNLNSLKGVITDVHLLSTSDFLVCTFSSQVCRIAYEIMQQRYPDAANYFRSLDDIWYYGGQSEHQQMAILEHTPKGRQEIELKRGDVIGVAGNHWNGYNKGRNHRNNRVGLYPAYKTKENIKLVDFPTYPHVEL